MESRRRSGARGALAAAVAALALAACGDGGRDKWEVPWPEPTDTSTDRHRDPDAAGESDEAAAGEEGEAEVGDDCGCPEPEAEEAAEAAPDGEGGGDEGGGDAAPEDAPSEEVVSTAARDLCLEMTGWLCGYAMYCCTDDEEAAIASTVVDCTDMEAGPFYRDCYARYAPWLLDGTASVYAAAKEGCRGLFVGWELSCPGLGALPLDRQWLLDSACSEVVRGNLSPLDACADTEQCAGAYFCQTRFSPSLCIARVARGGECNAGGECLVGDVCVQGHCAAPSAAGEPCDEEGDCMRGLSCNRGVGLCRELLADGQPCDPAADTCAGKCPSSPPHECASYCDGM